MPLELKVFAQLNEKITYCISCLRKSLQNDELFNSQHIIIMMREGDEGVSNQCYLLSYYPTMTLKDSFNFHNHESVCFYTMIRTLYHLHR